MTCIVGFEDRETGDVWMGADSAAVDGWGTTMVYCDQKLFELDFQWGKFLIGIAGSFRMGQLLRYKLEPQPPGIDPYTGDQDDLTLEYMATTFIEEVRRIFWAGGFLKKKHDREEGGSFLIGWRRPITGQRARLFLVDSDFHVGRPLYGLAAIGCGEQVALGALAATQSTLLLPRVVAPCARIESALKAAQLFKTGVLPPFVVKTI